MATEATIKRWGNSMGIVLPKDMIEKGHFHENDKVIVTVVKEADVSSSFGALKGKIGMSGQKLKDMVRQGWES
ncbi:AbrB/MazE/SpoVT family DNA-binding domain-containing protein [Candidatus Woesearchaeota archaeon]|nr:AbrB/MazE/SpoVT family DNA-binding domain-containing protein [Candidatus Woesearchaeota archaeon]